jgi:hypothetical protein
LGRKHTLVACLRLTNTLRRFGAIGPFGIPNFPELYDNFQGKVVHTAKWNMQLDEFTGKRVAVVGSGSRYQKFLRQQCNPNQEYETYTYLRYSGIQVIPKIAPYAKSLYSYQRTPAWVMPRQQFTYPAWIKRLYAFFPIFMWLHRCRIFLQVCPRFSSSISHAVTHIVFYLYRMNCVSLDSCTIMSLAPFSRSS